MFLGKVFPISLLIACTCSPFPGASNFKTRCSARSKVVETFLSSSIRKQRVMWCWRYVHWQRLTKTVSKTTTVWLYWLRLDINANIYTNKLVLLLYYCQCLQYIKFNWSCYFGYPDVSIGFIGAVCTCTSVCTVHHVRN